MGSLLNVSPKLGSVGDWLVHIIATSQPIKDHCLENFGESHRIFDGVIAGDPPGEEHTPFVAIERDRHLGGTLGEVRRGVRWEIYRFVVAVGVRVDTTSEPYQDDADSVLVERIDGIPAAEALAYKVRDELDEKLPASLVIESCEVIHTDSVNHPLFVTMMEIVISTPVALGGCSIPLAPPT